jgi:hypothetical protein
MGLTSLKSQEVKGIAFHLWANQEKAEQSLGARELPPCRRWGNLLLTVKTFPAKLAQVPQVQPHTPCTTSQALDRLLYSH